MAFKSRISLSGPATPQKKISVAPMMTLPPRPKSLARPPVEQSSSVPMKLLFGVVSVLVVVVAFKFVSSSATVRVPLCNNDGSSHSVNTTCTPCPPHGYCSNGVLSTCDIHYIVRGSDCIKDEQKFLTAVSMLDSISSRLQVLRGRKECGEPVEDSMYPEEFRVELRPEFRALSEDSFRAAFDLAIHGGSDGIHLPLDVIRTPLGLIRSTIAKKSLSCRSKEWFAEYGLTVLFAIALISFLSFKVTQWNVKRTMIRDLVRTIECNTHVLDERVQGMSVLDLRDKGMPLHHLDDRAARIFMAGILRTHPDIQSGEEISRAGEVVYWSAHRLRAEQARALMPPREPESPVNFKK
jgi:hypothetical protein